MGTLLYNREPLALAHNMDSYFRQKPPDCSLFSKDGCEFPVHKELFYQTKFMRRMIKSFSFDQCQLESCCKIQIMCPSLMKEELNLIVQVRFSQIMIENTHQTQIKKVLIILPLIDSQKVKKFKFQQVHEISY